MIFGISTPGKATFSSSGPPQQRGQTRIKKKPFKSLDFNLTSLFHVSFLLSFRRFPCIPFTFISLHPLSSLHFLSCPYICSPIPFISYHAPPYFHVLSSLFVSLHFPPVPFVLQCPCMSLHFSFLSVPSSFAFNVPSFHSRLVPFTSFLVPKQISAMGFHVVGAFRDGSVRGCGRSHAGGISSPSAAWRWPCQWDCGGRRGRAGGISSPSAALRWLCHCDCGGRRGRAGGFWFPSAVWRVWRLPRSCCKWPNNLRFVLLALHLPSQDKTVHLKALGGA